jgi:hypothetical protein
MDGRIDGRASDLALDLSDGRLDGCVNGMPTVLLDAMDGRIDGRTSTMGGGMMIGGGMGMMGASAHRRITALSSSRCFDRRRRDHGRGARDDDAAR